jgi:hypothetical protein
MIVLLLHRAAVYEDALVEKDSCRVLLQYTCLTFYTTYTLT